MRPPEALNLEYEGGSKLRSAWRLRSGGDASYSEPDHDAPFPAAGKDFTVVEAPEKSRASSLLRLAWSRVGARKVAAFAPAVLAQAAGQAAFVGCVAALASAQALPLRPLLIGALAGVVCKMLGQTAASAIQASWVGEIGQSLRAAVLGATEVGKTLRTPRLHDHASLARQVPGELAAHIEDVERGVGEGLLPAVRAVVELVPLSLLLLFTMPRFAAVALFALLPFVLVLGRTRRWLGRLVGAQIAARSHLLHAFDEAVRHDELWRVHGAAAHVRALVARGGHEHTRLAAHMAARTELASGQNEVLGVLFVWLCVALAPDVSTAPGLLVRFLATFFLLYKPMRQLVTARPAMQRGRSALSALRLSELPGEDAAPVVPRAWPSGVLEVDQLVAAHGSARPLSFRAAPGALVLLRGASGSGKTSVLRCLLGLAAPRGGSLRYAGEALDQRGVGPAERPFAWVAQSCPIVGKSVDDALLLGGAVRRDEHGLLSGVAGDAHTLSGGEAQRVALVRAFSSSMPVLLLDEPTAHLDADRAARVLAAIEGERARGRCVIVASHQLEDFARLPGACIMHLDPNDDSEVAA